MTEPVVSPGALGELNAYLPLDLTPKQMDQVLRAAAYMYARAFTEGREYQVQVTRAINNTVKESQP